VRTAAARAEDPGGAAVAASLDGRTLYLEACASCHGRDGRGCAEGTRLAVPVPDLTDCAFNTREPTSDWTVVVAHGGPAMGLSAQMPAFTGALEPEETRRVLDYVRGFCTDDRWPRGELNFRRPIFTSKAFPENEAVLTHRFTKGPRGAAEWLTRLLYERRVGPRGQVEIALPLLARDAAGDEARAGPGDLALGYKHVLYASLARMTIVAGSLELVLPSGDRSRGLGDGTVAFEPSLHVGTGLRPLVLQGQVKGLAPVDEGRASRGVRGLVAASWPLGPLRRDWVPTLELEAARDVTRGRTDFFLTPQVYKAIRTRGHVALAAGAQVPVGGRQPFDYRIVGFLLWEYADGGLWW
jgi:hypothetical protein